MFQQSVPQRRAARTRFSRDQAMRTSGILTSLVVAVGVSGFVPTASAQVPAGNGPPQFRSVERTARSEAPAAQSVAQAAAPAAEQHPLAPALKMAQDSLAIANQSRDFAFTFVKRELIAGKLTDHEAMFMKIRNQPFSVYVYTLGPKQEKGQEAIYVAGRNNNQIQVHVTGFRHKLIGMLSLAPDAPEIMDGNRYSMT